MKKKLHIIFFLPIFFFSCVSPTQEKVRIVDDFTENWRFYLGDLPDAEQPDFNSNNWRLLNLPHDWSIESDFSLEYPATPGGGALPGGIAWYRKEFQVSDEEEGKRIYVDFDGIYRKSKVWVNGHFLGERPSGYISFRYDLTPYLKFGAKNVIAVRVDNSEQPNSRWYSGSGIYRNVWLTKVNPIHVAHWGTYVTTPEVSSESAVISNQTTVLNSSDDNQTVELISILLDANGREIKRKSDSFEILAEQEQVVSQTININQPVLWSIDNPYLYTVRTEIRQKKQLIDNYETPLGIRYFSFDKEKGFFLNGESVKIKGVCQHHDLGCLGAAVNIRALERQLEILKAMGCNGIRTAHNPPAPELLDLCDKMGFIVQDEVFDMWRKKKSTHDYGEYFAEWYERDLTDFILRDRNHPSIFMWSIGNEILEQWTHIDTDTLDLQQANLMFNFADSLSGSSLGDELHVNSLLTKRLANIVKELDPTRPITSGNNETRPINHIFRAKAMDILGFNYHENDWLAFPETYPGENLIITESTSGLMSRGYYEMPSDKELIRPDRWDIPFDRPIRHNSSYDNCHVPWGTTHEKSWDLVKKNDFISGLYVWTGFDYLGEPTPYWWPARSSYFGIIDLAGFPKDVYYMYQSEWTDRDVLHIFPHWNWSEEDTVDVWAYYNHADEVELFLNGESLGSKSKTGDDYHVWWRVPYQEGTIKAISRKNGKEVLIKEIQTTGEPLSIRLTSDRTEIFADGKDLAYVTVEVVDKDGIPVPTADNLIRFTIEGSGFIVGTDNGDPTNHHSLKKPERNLFNGKAMVVVQSKKSSEMISLKAESEGLESGIVELRMVSNSTLN